LYISGVVENKQQQEIIISGSLIVTFLIVIWLWWIKIPWNDPEMSAN